MSYITKHVRDPHERIIYATRLHWIYIIQGLAWLVLMLAITTLAHYALPDPLRMAPPTIIHGINLGTPYLWAVAPWPVIGVILALTYLFKYISTELVVTTLRVIYKTGLIRIEVEEVELDDIEAEHIHHGWLGAFLGYGALNLDCRFVGDLSLPAFKNPYKLLRAVHYARQKVLNAPHRPPTVK